MAEDEGEISVIEWVIEQLQMNDSHSTMEDLRHY